MAASYGELRLGWLFLLQHGVPQISTCAGSIYTGLFLYIPRLRRLGNVPYTQLCYNWTTCNLSCLTEVCSCTTYEYKAEYKAVFDMSLRLTDISRLYIATQHTKCCICLSASFYLPIGHIDLETKLSPMIGRVEEGSNLSWQVAASSTPSISIQSHSIVRPNLAQYILIIRNPYQPLQTQKAK